MAFYEINSEDDNHEKKYTVSFHRDRNGFVKVEVSANLVETIVELQRELWREDKKASRRVDRFADIEDKLLPHEHCVKTPEQIVIAQIGLEEVAAAFKNLTFEQRRRYLMKHFLGFKTREIAEIEGCSIRAVQYSLDIAQKNLRNTLSDMIDDWESWFSFD